MQRDPIVTEIRRAREAHGARFNFDLQAIYLDLKSQEKRSDHKKVSFVPKRIPPSTTEMKPALAV